MKSNVLEGLIVASSGAGNGKSPSRSSVASPVDEV